MIAYIGLVYAFMGNALILNETIGALEICGVVLILLMNVLLIYVQMRRQKAEEVSSKEILNDSDYLI